MYQLSISIAARYSHWFEVIESSLKSKLDTTALVVSRLEPNRLYLAVACENEAKKKVTSIMGDALCDLYAISAKRDYYKENLILPLSPEKYNILISALVEFDSAADRELIRQAFIIENGLNIDGVYDFSFADIKARWHDIGQLTKENALFLTDNEIFFELIKYLFSAITPKTQKVSCIFKNGKYILFDCSNKKLIKEVKSEEDLLCTLIGVAPMCLELSGEHFDKGIQQKLSIIFNAQNQIKSANLQ